MRSASGRLALSRAPVSGGVVSNRLMAASILWRRASYSRMPAATAAFSDSTPTVGMERCAAAGRSSALTPCASLPMISAQRPVRSTSPSGAATRFRRRRRHGGIQFDRALLQRRPRRRRIHADARRASGTAIPPTRAASSDCTGSPCPSGTSRRSRRTPPPRARWCRHCPDPAGRPAPPPGRAREQLLQCPRRRLHQRHHALARLRRGESGEKRVRQYHHLDARQPAPEPFRHRAFALGGQHHSPRSRCAAPLPAGGRSRPHTSRPRSANRARWRGAHPSAADWQRS